MRNWRAHFGLSIAVVQYVWDIIQQYLPNSKPKHLLYLLCWMKVGATVDVTCNMVGASKNTFLKYRKLVMKALITKLDFVYN